MEQLGNIVVSQAQINNKVKELAEMISCDYKGKEVLLLCVLKGGFVFMADLMREIKVPVEVEFVSLSSYGDSTVSSGRVNIAKGLDMDIKGKNVVIVEDIVDTGLTIEKLKGILMERYPSDIKICSIIDKPSRRTVHIEIDYPGIKIPDKFVVGYGLDYAGKYRNLPEIYELKLD